MQDKDPKKLAKIILFVGLAIIAILLFVVFWQLIVIANLRAEIDSSAVISYIGQGINFVRVLCL